MNCMTLLITILIFPLSALAQDLYMTRTGHIYFISQTEIIDIDAHHHQVSSLLNVNTGEIAFALYMAAFEFDLALAQEHFNEEYVESHKYPKSTFSGRIVNLDAIDFKTPGTYEAWIEGELTIHGQTVPMRVKGTGQVEGDQIRASCRFEIRLADFHITVPQLVRDKVAPVIPIEVNLEYRPRR